MSTLALPGPTPRRHTRTSTVVRPGPHTVGRALRDAWRARELLYLLVARDVKLRYKQTAIGAAWVLAQPVLTIAVVAVVFGRIADLNSDRVPYPLFAMTGWLPWMYLSSAVALVTLSLVTDQSLLTKANFPRLLIPLTKAVRPLIDLVLGLGLMVPMMLWYEVAPTWRVAALPLCALYALVVALGVGLWLAPLNCRFRDVGNAVPFLVQVWMFSSPILYPATLVPVEGHFLYALNPAVGVIETFRWAVLGSADLDVELLVVSSGVAAAVLLIGLLVFARAERRLVDIL